MKYLLLLIPLQVFGQSWTNEIPDWDHENIANIKIHYVGDWVHMTNGGSYNKVQDTYLEYAFIGYEIHVFTERADHHGGYIVSIDHIDIDTVITNNDNFIKNYKTWFMEWEVQRNHIIKLRPLDNRPFVLDKFVTFTNSDPRYETIRKDTIIWDVIYLDSIVRVPVDSLYTNPVPVDSVYTNPIPLDSPYFVPVKVDSPYYVPLALDSPYYVPNPLDSPYYVPRPIEKPCPNCPDDSNNWWAWVIGGLSIALSLFVILYLTKN